MTHFENEKINLNNIDNEAVNHDQQIHNEIEPVSTEKKSFSPKQKKFLAAVAITTFIGSGVGGFMASKTTKAEATNTTPTTITEQQTTNNQENQKDAPLAASEFLSNYSNRYTDPVSTYFAEAAYEKAHNGKSVMMSDEFVDKYEKNPQYVGETSELGFYMLHLPVDTKIDEKVSIELFNSYFSKNLELYMNLIARNPSSEARDVIDKQFLNYCEGIINDGAMDMGRKKTDAEITTGAEKLLSTLSAVVAKHGDAANYSIAPASTDLTNRRATLYKSNTRVGHKGTMDTGYTNGGISLFINVDEYTNNNVYENYEIIDDVQISVYRQPADSSAKWTYTTFGQD